MSADETRERAVTKGPLTDIRVVETWWWERPNRRGSIANGRPDLLIRAQRIWGGRIEVIRQTITTVTTVFDETDAVSSPPSDGAR